jgi:hypothetical protein
MKKILPPAITNMALTAVNPITIFFFRGYSNQNPATWAPKAFLAWIRSFFGQMFIIRPR